jgi:hypothetical protein
MRVVAIPSLAVLAPLAPLAACFDPAFHDPTCGPSGSCPPGWMCSAGAGAACTLAPMPDAPPASCPSSWHEVLANGNFEKGHTAWVEGPAGDRAICSRSMNQLTLDTRDGDYVSCMGLRNTHDQVLSQQVTLPPGTTRARFQGFRCLASSDTTTTPVDTMTLRLTATSDDTNLIADLGTWSNLDATPTCRWDWFDLIADTTSSPPDATLRIHSNTNDTHVTSFYLDVTSLQAFAPDPCP